MFTIPANTTHAAFAAPQLALQAGSVAGSIDLSVESLDASGVALPTPAGARPRRPGRLLPRR